MSLRYLPGETEDMIETISAEVLEAEVVEEKDEVKEEEIEDDPVNIILDLEPDLITDIANVVARVVCKNIESYPDFANEIQRFIFEEITEGVETGLEFCNFSMDSFQLWYEMEQAGIKHS